MLCMVLFLAKSRTLEKLHHNQSKKSHHLFRSWQAIIQTQAMQNLKIQTI